MASVVLGSMLFAVSLMGCGDDDDNAGIIPEKLDQKTERCQSCVMGYYETVSHINRTMMMCLPFRLMDPAYFAL